MITETADHFAWIVEPARCSESGEPKLRPATYDESRRPGAYFCAWQTAPDSFVEATTPIALETVRVDARPYAAAHPDDPCVIGRVRVYAETPEIGLRAAMAVLLFAYPDAWESARRKVAAEQSRFDAFRARARTHDRGPACRSWCPLCEARRLIGQEPRR